MSVSVRVREREMSNVRIMYYMTTLMLNIPIIHHFNLHFHVICIHVQGSECISLPSMSPSIIP